MNPITVETTEQTVRITFDKTLVPIDMLTELLRTLEREYLAKTVNFSEDLLRIGEQIKKDWWQRNQCDFLKGTAYEDRH